MTVRRIRILGGFGAVLVVSTLALHVFPAAGSTAAPPLPVSPQDVASPRAPSSDEIRADQILLPAASTILQGLRPEHPRLLVTSDAVVQLRDRIANDPVSAGLYQQTRARATALLSQPPVSYSKPDGVRLLEVSREAVRRIYDLGLVWLVESDPQYAARGWIELEAISGFPDWNPLHFLDTAEMTHAAAIGYDWLYDALTPAQRTTVANAIAQKGLEPARLVFTGQAVLAVGFWAVVDHNWNNVVNGGLTIGALAIGDIEPELAGFVAHEALVRLPAALANYAPDGGWPEGVSYWEYATEYTVATLAALTTAVGTDFGLSAVDGLAATGDVPIHLTGPTGQRFNFADDGEPRFAPAVPAQFWLAARFGRTVLRDHQLPRAGGSALDALWYEPGGPAPEQLPLDRLFAGIDVVSLRGGWSGSASWVGFKGGDAGYNHNQLDLGSFVFEAEGERWALDLGKDDYNLPGYFQSWPGGARWAYYRNRAEGHNTLVIDPDACEDQDPRALATITRFQSSATDALAIADLTNAYRGRSVRRGVWLKGRTTLVVQDEIAADPTDAARGGADVWWFMHTRASIAVSSDGRSALLTQNGKSLRVRVVTPVGARFSVREATPLPTSPHPESQGSNAGVRKLTLHLSVAEPTTIVVVFEPDETSNPVDPDPRSLGDWQLDDAITTVERQTAAMAPSPDACHATASLSPTDTGIPDTVPVLATARFTG